MTKFENKWFGPYEVLEKVGLSAYKLKLPCSWKKVHPVFNEVLLKPAVQPEFPSQRHPPPPLPELVNEEEEYKVEEILNSHCHHRKLQFLVKWKGYTDATWQPEADLKNAQELVNEFYIKHPEAPK